MVMPVDLAHNNLMRETEVHNQILALLSNTVTYAVNVQLLLEALGYADNHVVDQGAGQAVQCAVLLLVVGTGNNGSRSPSTATLVMVGCSSRRQGSLGDP